MHAAKAPSTQNASVRPAESASSESGAGHEAHGHASKDGTTPQHSLAALTAADDVAPAIAPPPSAKPQCGAPTKLRTARARAQALGVWPKLVLRLELMECSPSMSGGWTQQDCARVW